MDENTKKRFTLSIDGDKLKELKKRAIDAELSLSDYLTGASDTSERMVAGQKEYKSPRR